MKSTNMLMRDPTNPRSLSFQVKGLADYVSKLELSHGRFGGDALASAQAALDDLRPRDLDPESEAVAQVLEQLRRCANVVSDTLTHKFFSHADQRSLLSLVA